MPERDALALAVELEDAHVDLVADLDDLRRVLDALPRHVRDVQQAVDAAEVHERAVVGQVLDHALDDVAFLQVVEQLRALGAVFLLDDRAARDHDVVAALVELDDLEFEFLAFEVARVAHRAHVHERAGQECADVVDFDGEAALDAAVDDALDDLALREGFLEAGPGAGALGFFARQAGFAGAVLDGIQRDLDLLADLDVDFAVLVAELIRGYDGFGLEADADDDDIGIHVDDGAGQDLAGLDTAGSQDSVRKVAGKIRSLGLPGHGAHCGYLPDGIPPLRVLMPTRRGILPRRPAGQLPAFQVPARRLRKPLAREFE